MLKPAAAAKYLNVTKQTLRNWEQQGVLSPHRTPGGHRTYTKQELDKAKVKRKSLTTHNHQLANNGQSKGFGTSAEISSYEPNQIPEELSQDSDLPQPFTLSKAQKSFVSLILTLLVTSSAALASERLGLIDSTPFKYLAERISPKITSPVASPQSSSPGHVLAAQTSIPNDLTFKVNIPANFTDTVTVEELITDNVTINAQVIAPNVLYSLTASTTSGLSITGTQNLTITNTDKGSSQKIFKTIKLGDDTVSAGSNTDTFEFVAGGAASLSLDTDDKKLTISTTSPDYTQSGWTTGTNKVILTTIGDNVGIGIAAPTSKLHVVGASNLAGDVTLGSATTDSLTFTGRMANGTSLLPDTDLGSDLGSASLRYNNIYAANLTIDSGFSSSGQALVTYNPTDTTFAESSLRINVTTPASNEQMLGIGSAGNQRVAIDAEGDLTLGYNDATSIPTTDNPLQIYGHNATNVAYINTSGDGYYDGNLGIGTTDPNAKLHVLETNDTNETIPLVLQNAGSSFPDTAVGIGFIAYEGTSITGKITNIHTGSGTYDLAFHTWNAGMGEKMRITNTGNLGIGTTAPGYKLEVGGTAYINGVLTVKSNGGLNFGSHSSYSSTAFDSGAWHFGLGSGSSGGRLLMLTDNADAYTNYSHSAQTNPTLMIHSATAASSATNEWGSLSFEGTGSGGGYFNIANGVGDIVLQPTGNLGIGTTDPSEELDVVGDFKASGSTITLSGVGAGTDDSVLVINGSGVLSHDEIDTRVWGSTLVDGSSLTAGYLTKASDSDTIANSVMYESSSKIGIGTTSPDAPLSFPNSVGAKVNFYDGLNYDIGIQSDLMEFIIPNGTANFTFGHGSSGSLTRLVTIKGSGNVGIGTTAPDTKLHIVGTARLQSDKMYMGTGTTYYIDGAANRINMSDIRSTEYRIGGSQLMSGTNPLTFGGQIDAIKFRTTTTDNAMYLKSDGNVGIGTTGPLRKFTVETSDAIIAALGNGGLNFIQLSNAATTTGSGMGLYGSSTGVGLYHFDNAIGFHTGNPITEKMRIALDGNVGIGTTNPGTLLSIQGVTPILRRQDTTDGICSTP